VFCQEHYRKMAPTRARQQIYLSRIVMQMSLEINNRHGAVLRERQLSVFDQRGRLVKNGFCMSIPGGSRQGFLSFFLSSASRCLCGSFLGSGYTNSTFRGSTTCERWSRGRRRSHPRSSLRGFWWSTFSPRFERMSGEGSIRMNRSSLHGIKQ